MKAYFPLWTYKVDHGATLANGVRLASREEVKPVSIDSWGEVLTGKEIRELREWRWALLYELPDNTQETRTPEQILADTHVALQVLRPQGNFLSFCVREQTLEAGSPVLTRFERFHGIAWSRMASQRYIPEASAQQVLDGVTEILGAGDARVKNPLRLFEHGMTSTNLYIRVLLWVTALDGILMAVKKNIFIDRLCGLLGHQGAVFPKEDDVHFTRDVKVIDVAEDLFTLRSELAHGHSIGKRFWEERQDLASLLPPDVYGDSPRYVVLLEESALALLTALLRLIFTQGLSSQYKEVSQWRRIFSTSR